MSDTTTDVFISYAHVDDQSGTPNTAGWVTYFFNHLRHEVNSKVGRAEFCDLWKDFRLSGNTAVTPEIEKQLSSANMLVLLLSSGWLAAPWCRYELEVFSRRFPAHEGRIFVVELEPIDAKDKPEILRDLLTYRFWRKTDQERVRRLGYPVPQPNNPEHQRFFDETFDLSGDLSKLLKRVKPMPTLSIQQAVPLASATSSDPFTPQATARDQSITPIAVDDISKVVKIAEAESTSPPPFTFPNKSSAAFRQDMQAIIAAAFESEQELRLAFLTQQDWSLDMSSKAISVKLLAESENKLIEVISNLRIVVKKLLQGLQKSNYAAATELIEKAERIVSALSLFVIQTAEADTLRRGLLACTTSLNITLAHATLAAAEVVHSERMQTIPRFDYASNREYLRGKDAVTHVELEFGIGKSDAFIDDIGKQFWVKIFPEVAPQKYNRETLRRHLRSTLKAKDHEKENYYLIVALHEANRELCVLWDKTARDQFGQAIPEIPIIVLNRDVATTGGYVAANDELMNELMVELYEFQKEIHKNDPK